MMRVKRRPDRRPCEDAPLPLRYYITIVRGIFLKGAGWVELYDEAAILLVYGILILALPRRASMSCAKSPAP